jgi:hypothetical protein
MMTPQQIQKEVAHYKSTKKLTTHPHLICTVTGEKVMAFGQMLEKKIERHGGLEKLLSTFVSRKAKSSQKPPKPQKATRRKRKEKIIEKVDEVYDIPTFRNEPPTSLKLSEYPEHTRGACLRPDIFLNNSRTCDECHLSNFCLASCKRFSKNYVSTI